jgi:hypothetical protein
MPYPGIVRGAFGQFKETKREFKFGTILVFKYLFLVIKAHFAAEKWSAPQSRHDFVFPNPFREWGKFPED